VRDPFDQWLKPRRAFRLVDAREIGTNPDQRIHEDARQRKADATRPFISKTPISSAGLQVGRKYTFRIFRPKNSRDALFLPVP
jgi:hypothetical protein